MATWIVYYVRTLLNGTRAEKKYLVQIAILLVGGVGPWLGLDVLRFDEFFLIPMYLCLGVMFLARQHEEDFSYDLDAMGAEV